MADFCELNREGWEEWLSGRPDSVRAIAEKLPPNKLYRLTTTDQRVTILAYSEDGTVSVDVSGRFNAFTIDREVFGIDPDTLVECDLPTAKEQEEIDALSISFV